VIRSVIDRKVEKVFGKGTKYRMVPTDGSYNDAMDTIPVDLHGDLVPLDDAHPKGIYLPEWTAIAEISSFPIYKTGEEETPDGSSLVVVRLSDEGPDHFSHTPEAYLEGIKYQEHAENFWY
jgi:hypothetical protein